MQTTPQFCTACGGPLAEGAQFCTACGAQVAAAAAAPVATPPVPPVPPAPLAPEPVVAQPVVAQPAVAPVAPAQTGERVVSVIPNASIKKGFMGLGRTSFVIVLTDRRLIFAHITTEALKQSVADARDTAKSDGKGFFGQWGAQISAYSKLAEGYLNIPPDQALAENPENFAIDKSTIVKVKLKAGTSTTDDAPDTPDRLILKTAADKYSIQLGSGRRQAKEALIAAEMI